MTLPKGKMQPPVLSTAGAVAVRNEKGEFAMEKVKVSRYVSGKRPEYAPESSDEDEDVEFGLGYMKKSAVPVAEKVVAEIDDRRLKRLQQLEKAGDTEDRVARHRRLHEPEILAAGSDGEGEDEEMKEEEENLERDRGERRRDEMEESSEEEEEELDEEEIERRRALLRLKAVQQREEEEVMELEEEKREGSEGDSSEWEEYTDSEEEDAGPRLKPVFVRKKDRVTIQEKEKELIHQRELEQAAKRLADDRRRETLKYIESEVRKELTESHVAAATAAGDGNIADVDTGDENDEEEYEAWKVRELKRIKRDREEKELIEKEHQEVERLHNMTEEERRLELKQNPKRVINKASKGKYKFLQKFYHRGSFFLDQEDGVYTRDFSAPTLEDHFDKTILPKVMQVKNFGRSGRTKYTHLVDQDTTSFDSPWASDTTMNLKFHSAKGGGMKQVFHRPTVKKRK